MILSDFAKLYNSTLEKASQLVNFNEYWKDSEDWSYTISSRMTQTAGLTEYSQKMFKFSKPYIEVYDSNEVQDTILHEIAHALTPNSKTAHDDSWKEMFILIGGSGQESFTSTKEYQDYINKYEMHCSNCGRTGDRSPRKTNIAYACSYCLARTGKQYILSCRKIKKKNNN